MEIKGCRAPRSCSSQAIVCHIGRSRDAGVDGRGGRAEINFSNFLASPSFPITASMTQPRWNVGSHGNPLWVLCSDGCRGCYRWSGCGGASAGNALKMVCISAVHLAEGFFFFCSPLCGAVPRWEISFRAAPGARGTRLQLAHEHPKSFWQREQKQQHRQGSKMRYRFPFWLHSAGAPRACSPLSSMHFWHCLDCFPFRVQFGDWANWESFEPAPSSTSPRALATLLVSSVKTWCMCKCHHSSSSRSLPGPWADRVRMSPAAARKDGVGKICPVCMSCREFLSQPNPLGSVTPNT